MTNKKKITIAFMFAISFAFISLVIIINGIIDFNDDQKIIPEIVMDAGNYNVNISGNIETIYLNIELKKEYQQLYSSSFIPIELKVNMSKCNNCPNFDNVVLWFYYEEINGLGYTTYSADSDNFWKIEVSPGKELVYKGKIKFSKSGNYKHYIQISEIENDYNLYNSTLKENVHRLGSYIKQIPIDDGFKLQQLKMNSQISGIVLVALGISILSIALTCWQMHLKQIDAYRNKRLLEELKSLFDQINNNIMRLDKVEDINKLMLELNKINNSINRLNYCKDKKNFENRYREILSKFDRILSEFRKNKK